VVVPIAWLALLVVVIMAFRSYIREQLRETGRDDSRLDIGS
jgi:hypothetical protein